MNRIFLYILVLLLIILQYDQACAGYTRDEYNEWLQTSKNFKRSIDASSALRDALASCLTQEQIRAHNDDQRKWFSSIDSEANVMLSGGISRAEAYSAALNKRYMYLINKYSEQCEKNFTQSDILMSFMQKYPRQETASPTYTQKLSNTFSQLFDKARPHDNNDKQQPRTPTSDSGFSLKNLTTPQIILIGLALLIAAFGAFRSKQRKIVVFANKTDLFTTLFLCLAFICPLLILHKSGGNLQQILNDKEGIFLIIIMSLSVLSFPILLYVVCKATYIYNDSINSGFSGFILSLYSKIVICIIAISLFMLFVILVILYAFGLNAGRNRGERKTTYSKRHARETKEMMAASGAIVAMLMNFGLWESNAVSFASYCAGHWSNPEESNEEAE